MGIITLALVAGGALAPGSNPPVWVIVSAGLAIALGTYLGGWRIIRTMGKGLTDLQPQQGFAAQTGAATVILASSHLGFSLSTTHVCSGAVMGAGLGRKGGVVRWSTATRMFVAWGLTLPAAGLVAALAELVAEPAGVVTTAIAAVTPPPAGTLAADPADPVGADPLKTTIPAPAGAPDAAPAATV